jgi:hypothetical protein
MAHKELLEVRSPRSPRTDRGYAYILDLDLDRDARRQSDTLIRVCVGPGRDQIGERMGPLTHRVGFSWKLLSASEVTVNLSPAGLQERSWRHDAFLTDAGATTLVTISDR